MPEQIPPAEVIEAVNTIDTFLKQDAPENRVSVSKENGISTSVNISDRDAIEARMATIENEDAAAFDRWFASLPEAERRRQKPRESSRGRAARLMNANAEYKQLASRLSALTTAGAPTKKLDKADEPFSQGTVSDMIAAEVEKRAVALLKSDPTLKTIDRAKAKVWQTDRHLWERSVANRSATV